MNTFDDGQVNGGSYQLFQEKLTLQSEGEYDVLHR